MGADKKQRTKEPQKSAPEMDAWQVLAVQCQPLEHKDSPQEIINTTNSVDFKDISIASFLYRDRGREKVEPNNNKDINVQEELDSLLAKAESIARDAQPEIAPEIHRLRMIRHGGPPKWDDEKLPEELKGLSAPNFLKQVYAGFVVDNKIAKSSVREFDQNLMDLVEGYISKRVRRGLDLGDAAGLTFVTKHRTEKHADREKTLTEKYGDAAAVVIEAFREDGRLRSRKHRERRREP
jgi:hypothetical protein